MSSPIDPTNLSITEVDLEVDGAVPLGLSGHLVGVGRDGVAHSFHLHHGTVSYLARSIRTSVPVKDLVAFDGSILAYSEDFSVHQLNIDSGDSHRVDLAGHGRTVVACPRYDRASGELHLVARDASGAQTHVVVPAGALTRRSRSMAGAPAAVQGLAIGADHIVFVADGFAGVAPRDGDAHTVWMATDVAAPRPVSTHRAIGSVILVALTPALERWTLHPGGAAIDREVLDATPGDLVVAYDTGRPDDTHAGWLVGLVYDPSSSTTDLRVSDATDLTEAPAAMVRIPRPIPHGLRCTWITRSHQSPTAPKENRP